MHGILNLNINNELILRDDKIVEDGKTTIDYYQG